MKRLLAGSTALLLVIVFRAEAITTTLPDSNDAIYTSFGSTYAGVARISITGVGSCTGALLSDGFHILTAAHCVWSGGVVAPGAVITTFDFGSPLSATAVDVAPGYGGTGSFSSDLAVVTLASAGLVPGYDIYRNTNEQFQVADIVGYGRAGWGQTGEDGATYPYGTKRHGQNRVEGATDDANSAPALIPGGTMLVFDFDSGNSANDFFAQSPYNHPDTGVGSLEVGAAHGDSGGPVFLNGKIAGVILWGSSTNTDVITDGGVHSSFGEIYGATRISSYTTWLDQEVAPEPATFALIGAGLAGLLAMARRRKHRRQA